MDSTTSAIKVFAGKALVIISFILLAFTTIKCDAQSIIGKWHRTATANFKIDKATGKQTPALTAEQQKQYNEATAANEYNEVIEFKSNNTYVSTVSTKGRKPMEHTEKYSLSGNKLDMNIAPVHNETPTITIKSINATTMVWDMWFRGNLMEITYTKV